MRLTKQQKVLIVAGGLGVAALGFDKLVLGPPSEASADPAAATPAEPTDPAGDPSSPTASDPAVPRSTATLPAFTGLTTRLREAGPAVGQPFDPFRLPEGWQPTDPVNPAPPQQEASDYAKPFLDQYKLKVILSTGKEPLALINNAKTGAEQVVYIGQVIYTGEPRPGLRLREVNQQRVVWESLTTGELVTQEPLDVYYRLRQISSQAVIWESVKTQQLVVMNMEGQGG